MSADTTLNNLLASPPTGWSKSLYYQHPPDDAPFPYVIFQKQSGTPGYTFGGRDLQDEVWLVKGVDRSENSDTAESIQARLDALLTDGTLSISGLGQRYLRRESDTDYAEVTDGIRYLHAGSLFRLVVE